MKIYLKEGIYVALDGKRADEYLIYCSDDTSVYLYGGRVEITNITRHVFTASLVIDGIPIKEVESPQLKSLLSFTTIASHLNAVEAHGVDAFLENYKKSIEVLHAELKELNHQAERMLSTEQDDLKVKKLLFEISNYRHLLASVLIVLFSVSVTMAAGLENERVHYIAESLSRAQD